jgi:DNA-damage-inducible protein J
VPVATEATDFTVRGENIPLDVPLEEFNRETVAALREAKRLAHDPAVRRYSVEEALRELKR